MNILIITYQGDVAGSTYSISYLAKGLSERGHHICVACRRESLLYRLLTDTAVVLIPMTFRSKWDSLAMQKIRDIVIQHHIQIINAQSSKDRYLSIFAKWRYRLPVAIVHTRRQKPESMGGYLQRQFYVHNTAKIVVISSELKKEMVRNGFPEHHLQVIMNGIDPQKFAVDIPKEKQEQLRQHLQLSPADTVILCVARRKNQEQLIAALPFLANSIKVVLVGVAADSYSDLAQKLGVANRLRYAGVVPFEELLAYYSIATLKVLPSTMDGFGMALIEAMGMGVPVIGTRSQGIIDVIGADEKNGLLFDDNNIPQLVQQIQRFLSDEMLRKHYIEQGKKALVEQFSIQRTIQEYEQFFQTLLVKHTKQ